MLTHRLTFGFANGANNLSRTVSITAGAEHNIAETIPATTTDQLVAFVLDVSQAKALYLVSDQAITIETNSGGSPVNVFTLAANVPFVWAGSPALRDTAGTAVTTDITGLYVTNAGDAAAHLEIRCLVDPTI